MASTFSPNLRIELIGAGEQTGTWGTTTNTNLGTLIEAAIAGYTTVTVLSASQALTASNGAADQARNAVIELASASEAFAVYAPPESKQYTVFNNTSYTATIYNSTVLGNTTAAGAGVAIPAGKTMTVWTDGTDFVFQNTHIIGTVVGNVTGNLTGNVTGNTTGIVTGGVTAIAALNIDCSLGQYFTKTISGDSTFTFSNVPSGVAYSLTVEITHTSGVITWPAAVKWPNDAPPALTTGNTHLFMFVTDDAGTVWHGAALVNYPS